MFSALIYFSVHASEGGYGRESYEPIPYSFYDEYDMYEDYYDFTAGKLCHSAIVNEEVDGDMIEMLCDVFYFDWIIPFFYNSDMKRFFFIPHKFDNIIIDYTIYLAINTNDIEKMCVFFF